MSASTLRAAEIYSEQLFPLGHGLALWYPEPDTKQGDLEIGDVGYIFQGSFRKLFNVTRQTDVPTHMPSNFAPLAYSRETHVIKHPEALPKGAVVSSSSIRKFNVAADAGVNASLVGAQAGVSFKCTRNKGALLVLDEHGADQEILAPNGLFPSYMLEHHESWCGFAKDHGLDIPPEEIIMIRGTLKASRWTVAAFTSESHEQSLSFEITGGALGSVGSSLEMSRSDSVSPMHRSGPTTTIETGDDIKRLAITGMQHKNQCVFISRYKLRRRLASWGPRVIRAEGEHRDEHGADEDEERGHELESQDYSSSQSDCHVSEDGLSKATATDPLDVILEFILDSSECKAAIASDEDVRILKEFGCDLSPELFEEKLRELNPDVVSAGSVGCLAISDSLFGFELDIRKPTQPEGSDSQENITNLSTLSNPALKHTHAPDSTAHITRTSSQPDVSRLSPPLEFSKPRSPSMDESLDPSPSPSKDLVAALDLAREAAPTSKDATESDATIGFLTRIVDLIPDDDPRRSQKFAELGRAWLKKCEDVFSESVADLAIDALNESWVLMPEGETGEPAVLADIGTAWLLKAQNDIEGAEDAAIDAFSRAERLTADDDPSEAARLLDLGRARLLRSKIQGTEDDLEAAIEILTRLDELASDDDELKARILSELGAAWLRKCDSQGPSRTNLAASLAALARADELTLDTDPLKLKVLDNLVKAQSLLCRTQGTREALDAAIAARARLVQLTPEGDVEETARREELMEARLFRYHQWRSPDDLEAVIQDLYHLVEVADDDDPAKPARLAQLGSCWLRKCERIYSDEAVDMAIVALTHSWELTAADSPNLLPTLSDLGEAWLLKFKHDHSDDAIESAITAFTLCTERTGHGDPCKADGLLRLGQAWLAKCENVYSEGAANMAIAAFEELRDSELDSHDDSGELALQTGLGKAWLLKATRNPSEDAIERAISAFLRAQQLTYEDDPSFSMTLGDIGRAFLVKYKQQYTEEALEQAIASLTKSAETIGDEDSSRLSSILSDLGEAWILKYEHGGSKGAADMAVEVLVNSLSLIPNDDSARPVTMALLERAENAGSQEQGSSSSPAGLPAVSKKGPSSTVKAIPAIKHPNSNPRPGSSKHDAFAMRRPDETDISALLVKRAAELRSKTTRSMTQL